MYLGIEIGGTKLQLGLGRGDGTIVAKWRGVVVAKDGGEGIRKQFETAIPALLATAGAEGSTLEAVGVGFGGPTDDDTQTVIKSHHIDGWDGFPLAEWVTSLTALPCVICNDADVAGLAEAEIGAGRGFSPIFYVTVGSGIGGGLVINGEIYRGVGKGAAEVGHLRPVFPFTDKPHDDILETFASGWGIGRRGSRAMGESMSGLDVANAAANGDAVAKRILDEAVQALAEGLCSVIKLLCPRRIVIGGGVSLIGEDLLFKPLRRYVAERGFAAFAGLTEIVPAALGEDVVLHGAVALARKRFGRPLADGEENQ
jgi:glucokinase